MAIKFGNTRSAMIDYKENKRFEKAIESRSSASSGFKSIMQRSRLSEKDLEQFQQNIIEHHKKKNYRVLAISAAIFTFIGLLLLYLTF